MVSREIWNKFTEVTFEIFEISRVKRGKFKNFSRESCILLSQGNYKIMREITD